MALDRNPPSVRYRAVYQNPIPSQSETPSREVQQQALAILEPLMTKRAARTLPVVANRLGSILRNGRLFMQQSGSPEALGELGKMERAVDKLLPEILSHASEPSPSLELCNNHITYLTAVASFCARFQGSADVLVPHALHAQYLLKGLQFRPAHDAENASLSSIGENLRHRGCTVYRSESALFPMEQRLVVAAVNVALEQLSDAVQNLLERKARHLFTIEGILLLPDDRFREMGFSETLRALAHGIEPLVSLTPGEIKLSVSFPEALLGDNSDLPDILRVGLAPVEIALENAGGSIKMHEPQGDGESAHLIVSIFPPPSQRGDVSRRSGYYPYHLSKEEPSPDPYNVPPFFVSLPLKVTSNGEARMVGVSVPFDCFSTSESRGALDRVIGAIKAVASSVEEYTAFTLWPRPRTDGRVSIEAMVDSSRGLAGEGVLVVPDILLANDVSRETILQLLRACSVGRSRIQLVAENGAIGKWSDIKDILEELVFELRENKHSCAVEIITSCDQEVRASIVESA